MSWFVCKGCPAKESEIAHLREMVERLITTQNPVFAYTGKREATSEKEEQKFSYDDFGSPILDEGSAA